jgi:hypothetical protein
VYRPTVKKMQKILLLSVVAITLLISSCQKENVNPNQSENDPNKLINSGFKYKKEVRIYDGTQEHYLTVKLESNSIDLVNNAYEMYNNLELVLLYDKPTAKNTGNTTKISDENPNAKQLSKQDILSATFGNLNNRDNATGYTFVTKGNSRDTGELFIPNHSSALIDITCSQFYVYVSYGNLSGEEDYYYDAGAWHLIQSHGTINQGSSWWFTGPYSHRNLWLHNSYGFYFPTHVYITVYY